MRTLDGSTPAGARALERLTVDEIGWLTSVDPEGQPQSSPVWFLWRDAAILVFSHHRAPRNGNIAERPRVAFHLETRTDGDDYVTIEGIATFDPEAPSAAQDVDYLAKYRPRIEAYGWTSDWFAREYPHAIRIAPTRWRIG